MVPSKKPITVADQIAVDSNGRRRFHGAFTGGFSAGYWNTVGSKDGWTPQTFKSSRAEKANYGSQNPMDFMDDEDTCEFGIAPQRIQTTEDFTRTEEDEKVGQKRKHQTPASSGPIPGVPVLHLLLKSCHDKVTINLLKKMGWKSEQQRSSRKHADVPTETENQQPPKDDEPQPDADVAAASRVISCDMGPIKRYASSEDDDSDDDSDSDLSFEMDESYTIGVKTERFGIDYVGLDRSTFGESSTSSGGVGGQSERFSLFPTFEVVEKNQKKLSIKGQAFGVGAFEEDDEDIYAREDIGKYDFVLGEKASNAAKNVKKLAAPSMPGEFRLDGFHAVDSLAKSMKKTFRIDVPRAYEPRNWIKRKSRFSAMVVGGSTQGPGDSVKVGRHDLTPLERGMKLGHTKAIPVIMPTDVMATQSAVEEAEPRVTPMDVPKKPSDNAANSSSNARLALIPLMSDRYEQPSTFLYKCILIVILPF